MLFFQFPGNLPRIKQPVSKKGKEKAEHSVSSDRFGSLKKGCRLEELPEGYVGKMLVYKSGAVKLKIGETLFDVSLTYTLLDTYRSITIPKSEFTETQNDP